MRPALTTAGIGLGLPSASFILGMLVDQLVQEGFKDWELLAGKALAFVLLAGWALVTAKHPEVQTGFKRLDGTE